MEDQAGQQRIQGRQWEPWMNVWPMCTAHPDCGHGMSHETGQDARSFAMAYVTKYVSQKGYALCTCHDASEADALGVRAFRCDEGGLRWLTPTP